MKPFILILISAFTHNYVAANPACIPTGDTIEFVLSEETEQPAEKSGVFPIQAVKGVETTLTVLNTLQALTLTPNAQSGQGVRSANIMKALICKDSEDNIGESLTVAASPLRMELGDTPLRYHLGAVMGNWVVFSGTALISGALAKRFGSESVGFPGVASIPALFLLPATTESTVKLIAQGTSGETAAGVISALAQTAGVAMIGVLMHPRFFHATWQDGWKDAENFPGFVGKTGAIYEGLRDQRNWFAIVDVGTSVLSGLLAGLQGSANNCGAMLIANAITYSGYAVALIALKPYENKYEQYFFSGVAVAQAAALTAQAIVHGTASEETADKVRPAAQGVVMTTEILLSIKGAYDVLRRFTTKAKNLLNFLKEKEQPVDTTNLQDLSVPLNENDADSILGIQVDTSSIDSEELRRDLNPMQFTPEQLAELDADIQQQNAASSSRSSSIARDIAALMEDGNTGHSTRTQPATLQFKPASLPGSRSASISSVAESLHKGVGNAVTLVSEAGKALLQALGGQVTQQELEQL